MHKNVEVANQVTEYFIRIAYHLKLVAHSQYYHNGAYDWPQTSPISSENVMAFSKRWTYR